VEADETIARGLGFAIQVSGEHAGQIGSLVAGSAQVGLTLVTATVGPRYVWQAPLHGRQFQLFGQSMIGRARGTSSVFPTPQGAEQSNVYCLAAQAGGGADLALPHRFALRLVEAGWLRTQLPNGASNVENSFQLGAGFAYRLP
jgi:hypothetical protein